MMDEDSRRYVIDPRIYRKDKFYIVFMVVFWLVWAPATAVVTLLAICDPHPFFFIWLIFGYLGTILIPLSLLGIFRKQVLEVDGDALIIHGLFPLLKRKIHICREKLDALTLEHYGGDDPESVYSLNLMQKRGARPRRVMLAYFVHPKDKAILFEEIEAFLFNHGFEFETKNMMAAKKGDEQNE